jgi:uncharacterized membrane protein (GlpM family)
MDIIIRFVLGGLAVTAVTVLANRGMSVLAGILMVFPIITVVSFIFIQEDKLITVAKSGLVGLVLTGFYIAMTIWFYRIFSNRFYALLMALLLWTVLTFVVILFFRSRM